MHFATSKTHAAYIDRLCFTGNHHLAASVSSDNRRAADRDRSIFDRWFTANINQPTADECDDVRRIQIGRRIDLFQVAVEGPVKATAAPAALTHHGSNASGSSPHYERMLFIRRQSNASERDI